MQSPNPSPHTSPSRPAAGRSPASLNPTASNTVCTVPTLPEGIVASVEGARSPVPGSVGTAGNPFVPPTSLFGPAGSDDDGAGPATGDSEGAQSATLLDLRAVNFDEADATHVGAAITHLLSAAGVVPSAGSIEVDLSWVTQAINEQPIKRFKKQLAPGRAATAIAAALKSGVTPTSWPTAVSTAALLFRKRRNRNLLCGVKMSTNLIAPRRESAAVWKREWAKLVEQVRIWGAH